MGDAFEASPVSRESASAPPSVAHARVPRARGSRRIQWRALLRALHRDVGYAGVGLTFVYALSGLAVNHIADWDPNFQNTQSTHELGVSLPDDDAAAKNLVLQKLGIQTEPKEVYREGDELEVLFEHRSLHVTVASGHVVDEEQKPRPGLRQFNFLHLNRGKKAWKYFADAYAVALLFLAASGMFMIAGRKGLFGRGAFFVSAGIALPVVYLLWAGH
jgi:hypothetical protein